MPSDLIIEFFENWSGDMTAFRKKHRKTSLIRAGKNHYERLHFLSAVALTKTSEYRGKKEKENRVSHGTHETTVACDNSRLGMTYTRRHMTYTSLSHDISQTSLTSPSILSPPLPILWHPAPPGPPLHGTAPDHQISPQIYSKQPGHFHGDITTTYTCRR